MARSWAAEMIQMYNQFPTDHSTICFFLCSIVSVQNDTGTGAGFLLSTLLLCASFISTKCFTLINHPIITAV
jgi:hypothetical protein